jgi:Fe-S-cluster containining protein
MKRWVAQGREDILRQVTFCRQAPVGDRFEDGFFFERTVQGKGCPFLEDNLCSIQETKPVCCRDAPDSLTKFDCCKHWDKSFINSKRQKKLAAKHDRDFKNCVKHFKELLEITLRAKGYGYRVTIC